MTCCSIQSLSSETPLIAVETRSQSVVLRGVWRSRLEERLPRDRVPQRFSLWPLSSQRQRKRSPLLAKPYDARQSTSLTAGAGQRVEAKSRLRAGLIREAPSERRPSTMRERQEGRSGAQLPLPPTTKRWAKSECFPDLWIMAGGVIYVNSIHKRNLRGTVNRPESICF